MKSITTTSSRLLVTRPQFSYRLYTSVSEQTNASSSSSSRFDTTFLFETKLPADTVKTNINKYKSDAQTLARWLDISVTHRQGKAYELAPTSVVSSAQSFSFPALECYPLQSLLGNQRNLFSFPASLKDNKGPKIVLFSFKQYGFGLLRNWLDVLLQEQSKVTVPIYEICFIEYSFLSMAKKMFAKNISSAIMKQQVPNTFLKFGEIPEFAGTLLLPNVYTGYVFLLDDHNRVRWITSGEATEDDIARLTQAITDLKTRQ